jgi:IstB-like ATP binding protein
MTSGSGGTRINQTLINDLAGGGFIAQQREAVLVGGTGTGKTHLAIAIARSCIRSGAPRALLQHGRPRQLHRDRPATDGRAARRALTRMDFIVLDELGYLPCCPVRRPASVPSRQADLRARLRYRHHQSRLRRIAQRVRRTDAFMIPPSLKVWCVATSSQLLDLRVRQVDLPRLSLCRLVGVDAAADELHL